MNSPKEIQQSPKLSIIIVSYNTKDMTLECLASVYEQTTCDFEVIVVDNDSSDGSADAIRAAFPQVRLLAETTNHGFAAAHDIALPYCQAPWLLLLNPDTLVLDHAIDNLMRFAQTHPDAGIWGGRTLYADHQLNPYSCWRKMTLWSVFCRTVGLTAIFPRSELFNPETYGSWPRDRIREVDIVTGCLFLIRRSTWDELGGFDPVFVMYGEEADLCLRAQKLGHRPAITPDATIVHYGGASEKVRSDKMVRVLRAKAELLGRHFPRSTRPLGRLLLSLWPLSRFLALYAIGFVTRNQGYLERAMPWKDIWNRRAEWRNGF